MAEATPMMAQYREARAQLPPRTLLLFRLGDFYELFDADAHEASRLLGLTLTHRQGQPMAGLPYHAVDGYIPKLLAAGWKVALCDQVEAPKPGKLVRRQLTRILTPGTTLEEHQVEAKRGHFLVALHDGPPGHLHAAWLDLTTGEFFIATEGHAPNLLPVLAALDPREVLLPEGLAKRWHDGQPAHAPWAEAWLAWRQGRAVNEIAPWHFDPEDGARTVREALKVLTLDGFGIARQHPALGCAGALLHYCAEALCAPPANLQPPREYRAAGTLLLDPATLRALEVHRSATGGREGSLLAAMDGTRTAAGARLLEQWLATPTLDRAEIARRQELVQAFVEAPGPAEELAELLGRTRDLARSLGRLQNRLRHPRELAGIRDTLQQLPAVRALLDRLTGHDDHQPPPVATLAEPPPLPLSALAARLSDLPELRQMLERALADSLPAQVQDGGVVREGWDAELDRLRNLGRDHQQWIAAFEAREQARTGIRNLRIRYNGAFGYAIEITKSNLAAVPSDYIRKQTMTNAERFTTPELREREREITHAEENALAREGVLFAQLIEAALAQAPALRDIAAALAELDVVLGWAHLARLHDWVRPTLDDGVSLVIEGGRHPVVEATLKATRFGLAGARAFVPNDTLLDGSGEQIVLLTGPNMAGKSTYIRQVALIVLMAQVGCSVPARRVHLGVVDRIFARVGASDELARGHSTFMVEMTETANILHHATARSLVILDEIGRGTSTYDGLAIAWAVVEHLHGDPATATQGPRTLFATHYHELTRLPALLPRVRNFHVAVREWNDDIIFVREVRPGPADRSYGIQVARLAGLPAGVIGRARQILETWEAGSRAVAEVAQGGSGAVNEPTTTTAAAAGPRRPRRKLPDPPAVAQEELF